MASRGKPGEVAITVWLRPEARNILKASAALRGKPMAEVCQEILEWSASKIKLVDEQGRSDGKQKK